LPKVIWRPNPGAQTAILQCPIFEMLIEGDRGGGKTDVGLMDYAQHVGQGFGASWRGILFRETYKQLQDVTAKSKKWFYQAFPNAEFNSADSFWHWPTGEHLYFRQFARPDDYWNYHGHEYPWIMWEELCNHKTLQGYKMMFSCCRSTHPNIPRKNRATANPYGKGHNLVKHRFQLPGMSGKIIRGTVDEKGRKEPPRIAINLPRAQNRILLDADPDYIDRVVMAATNESMRAAWEEGSWDIVAGGMFDDLWQTKVHVVPNFSIPQTWKIDRAFDWGSSAPFSVGWWAESDGSDVTLKDGQVMATIKGDLFLIAEWYGWNGIPNEGIRMLAVDISRGMVEREIKMGFRPSPTKCRIRPGPADSAIFTVENGNCIADDMAKKVRIGKLLYKGTTFSRADKRAGSRKLGWEQVRQRLSNSVPPEGKPREYPGIFIFDDCHQVKRTFPVASRDEKDLDDLDTDTEDHNEDMIRYRTRASTIKIGSGKTTGHF
jgi:hypothetical protein